MNFYTNVIQWGNNLLVREIKNLCRSRFSSYKVPGHIEFWDTIPKTPSKKLLRRKVRDLINEKRN